MGSKKFRLLVASIGLTVAALASLAAQQDSVATPCRGLSKEDCVAQMREKLSERVSFGILLLPLREQRRQGDAHFLLNVVARGPAAQAGIENGARLIGWKGQALTEETVQDFLETSRNSSIGDSYVFLVEQKGKKQERLVAAAAPNRLSINWRIARVLLETYGSQAYNEFLEEHGMQIAVEE